jgi:hypothetical protein
MYFLTQKVNNLTVDFDSPTPIEKVEYGKVKNVK